MIQQLKRGRDYVVMVPAAALVDEGEVADFRAALEASGASVKFFFMKDLHEVAIVDVTPAPAKDEIRLSQKGDAALAEIERQLGETSRARQHRAFGS